jgi:cytochrome c-type biogenesis protein CcsB
MFLQIENFLANFSFLTLFLSMLFYWIEISNLTVSNTNGSKSAFADLRSIFLKSLSSEETELKIVGKGVLGMPPLNKQNNESSYSSNPVSVSSSVNSAQGSFLPNADFLKDPRSSLLSNQQMQSKLGITSVGEPFIPFYGLPFTSLQNWPLTLFVVIAANLSIFFLLLIRWKESGHFPLSNLYESLMFLSWTLTTIHIFLELNLLKSKQLIGNQNMTESFQKSSLSNKNLFVAKLLGSITTPSALFTNAFATFSLPKEMQEASPLVPALQSNWLMMHVTVMILSYGALLCGSLLAIAFLVITGGKDLQTKKDTIIFDEKLNTTPTVLFSKTKTSVDSLNKLALTFDNLSYRILGIGFPLLTIGILSGAVWANEAWGSYWSWDPKETWALLTWLVFAIYLHTRLNKGWQGKKPAFIASLGFLFVWVCYLGVNLLGEGLHSYGWFSK